MERRRYNLAAALILVLMLLLPLGYVGSSLALVTPGAIYVYTVKGLMAAEQRNYRVRGDFLRLFWPLEQLHRLAWPGDWPNENRL